MTIPRDKLKEFESEAVKLGKNPKVDWNESYAPESRGCLFGEFYGVTLMVYPNGLINVPSVRSYHPPKYPTPASAAAAADELWAKQKARDDANLQRAKQWKTGHLGPIVEPDLKCRNVGCSCQKETLQERQKRTQGGFNTNPNWCS